jgi:polysaccharide export outer membrane protein
LLIPPLFLFLRDHIAHRHLRRLLRHSTPASQDIVDMFQKIRGNNRAAIVRLRISEEIIAPIVFGVFRPTLLLPGTARSTAPSPALYACLAHEWAHLKNGDLLTWNIIRWLQYPLYMQPFYWLLRSRLLIDQDFLADDESAQSCSELADYAELLLNFAQKRSAREPRIVLGMAGRSSQLKRRITMLLNESRPARKSNKRKLLLPLVLLIALTLLGGTLRFGEAQTQPNPPIQSPPRQQGNNEPTLANAAGSEVTPLDDKTRAERIKSLEITYAEKWLQIAELELEAVRNAFQADKTTKLELAKAEFAVEQAKANLELQKLIPRPANIAGGMQPWKSYIIESPDILNVEAVNLVPKSPYQLRVFDVVGIDVVGVPPNDPIAGMFVVEPGGNIQLGSMYGAVKVEGLSIEEARAAITKHLSTERLINPTVTVKLARMGDMQKIAGNHTVGPDGFITLGSYGRVFVHGLSVLDCQKAIETHLEKFLEKPNVVVTMFSINSKKYYVITRMMDNNNRVTGEHILTFPCTGNDTVLDAVGNVMVGQMGNLVIKHIRPSDDDKPPVVKVLDWEKILFSKSGIGDNLQLFPGDRIVLEMTQ